MVLSPGPVKRNNPDLINKAKEDQEEEQQRLIHLKNLTLQKTHLKPQSASAPCSPRLGLRRPQQQITITSSATLKVTNNQNSNRGSSTPRNRSKSPAIQNSNR